MREEGQVSEVSQKTKTYKSPIASCRTVLPTGKVIHFSRGLYSTTYAVEIAALDKMIEEGSQFLSVASPEEIADTVAGKSLAQMMKDRYEIELREKILAELAAEKSLAGAISPEALKPISTAELAGAIPQKTAEEQFAEALAEEQKAAAEKQAEKAATEAAEKEAKPASALIAAAQAKAQAAATAASAASAKGSTLPPGAKKE